MKPNLQEYIPEKSSFVFSSEGYQRIKIDSDVFYSSVLKNINPIKLHSPSSIDTSWTTNNTYLANIADKKLYKLNSNGVVQKSVQLIYPTIVSILQGDKRKTSTATAIELGTWVVDGKELKRFDENLNLLVSASGLISPIAIATSNQNGCYLADDYYKMIIEIDNSGQHIAYISYDSMLEVPNEKIISLKTDYNGGLWILGSSNLYNVQFKSSGIVEQKLTIQLKSIVGNTYIHSCIDIDRWAQNYVANESSSSISENIEANQFIYTASGNSNDTIICKLTQYGKLIQKKKFKNYCFPLTMKVGQNRYSKSIMTLQVKNYDEMQSSFSNESSSSLPPGQIWFISSLSKNFWKLNSDDLSKTFYGTLPFYPKSLAHDSFRNINYIIDNETNKLYFYSIQDDTTTLASSSFSGVYGYNGTEKTSLCVSQDGQYLWALGGNKINIGAINQSTYMVDFYPSVYSLVNDTLVSIGDCTGISIHPKNGNAYISTRDAIWYAKTNDIKIGGDNNIVCTKLVNKASGFKNGIQDVLFLNDSTMMVLDSSQIDGNGNTNIFRVNYENPYITYEGVVGWNSPIGIPNYGVFECFSNGANEL